MFEVCPTWIIDTPRDWIIQHRGLKPKHPHTVPALLWRDSWLNTHAHQWYTVFIIISRCSDVPLLQRSKLCLFISWKSVSLKLQLYQDFFILPQTASSLMLLMFLLLTWTRCTCLSSLIHCFYLKAALVFLTTSTALIWAELSWLFGFACWHVSTNW